MSAAMELAEQLLNSTARESYALRSYREGQAWKCRHFRKAFDEQAGKTKAITKVEEHNNFVQKCIQLHVIPRRDQVFDNSSLGHKNIMNYEELLIAGKEAQTKLDELEKEYRKTFVSTFHNLSTSFQNVFLRHILKKARSSRNQIKGKYICKLNTLRDSKNPSKNQTGPQFSQTRSKNASTSSEYPKSTSSSSDNDSRKCSPKALWSIKANEDPANRDKVEHLQSKVENYMFFRSVVEALVEAAQRKETCEADKLSVNMDELSLNEKS